MQNNRIPEFRFEELHIGKEASHAYKVTNEIYESFLNLYRDINPLHVDEVHAEKNGFLGKVMHGGILNGFLSHFVGMVLPGKSAILLSVEIRYVKPNYLNDEIQVTGRVIERLEDHGVIVLELTFKNLTQNQVSARAKVQVGTLKT